MNTLAHSPPAPCQAWGHAARSCRSEEPMGTGAAGPAAGRPRVVAATPEVFTCAQRLA